MARLSPLSTWMKLFEPVCTCSKSRSAFQIVGIIKSNTFYSKFCPRLQYLNQLSTPSAPRCLKLVVVGPSVAPAVSPSGSRTACGLFNSLLNTSSVAGLLVPRPLVMEVQVDAVSNGCLVSCRVLNLLPLPLLVAAFNVYRLPAGSLNVVLRSVSPLFYS